MNSEPLSVKHIYSDKMFAGMAAVWVVIIVGAFFLAGGGHVHRQRSRPQDRPGADSRRLGRNN
jgi:hypothetical protein